MIRHRPSVATLALLGLVVLAIAAPWLAPYAPHEQFDPVRLAWQPPSAAHLFGTDSFSRDVLSRFLVGAGTTLAIASFAVLIAMTLGIAVGATAALGGGRLEALLMRITDAVLAIPRLLLLLLAVAGSGPPPVWVLALLLGATGWMTTSRIVRQELRRLLATEYARGARALGVPRMRLLRVHLLPALAPTIAAAAAISFAVTVPLEAGLSYLGLGVRDPAPSWGNILHDGRSAPFEHWWLILFPTLAIAITSLAANAIGERLGARLQDGATDRAEPER